VTRVKALTKQRKLDGSADGRIFFERSMQTASLLVFEIILQDPRNPAAWKTLTGSRHSGRPPVIPQGILPGDRGTAGIS